MAGTNTGPGRGSNCSAAARLVDVARGRSVSTTGMDGGGDGSGARRHSVQIGEEETLEPKRTRAQLDKGRASAERGPCNDIGASGRVYRGKEDA